MASEFDLIGRYFARGNSSALLGIGDDCALLQPRPGHALAVSKDLLLEGRHFLPGTDPVRLGHKSLAVNLSDLAAMGAEARWALLGIALPEADETWVAGFAQGFFALAERHGVELVGGDTTRGPLVISITIIGDVPPALALRRDGARVDDDIWLSGATGEAALALAHLQQRVIIAPPLLQSCLDRLETPAPRLALGAALRGRASSAIDVSDGLLADLGHILDRSSVGAEIELARMPMAPALLQCADTALARNCLLAGGDDYELVFTASVARRDEIAALSAGLGLALNRIGRITAAREGLVVRDVSGAELAITKRGFDHFA